MPPAAALVFAGPAGPQRFALKPLTTLGRSAECDVVLTDASISRRHAQVEWVGERWVLTDQGSRFGCLVNQATVHRAELKDGDEVQLGKVVLRFEQRGDSPLASAGPTGESALPSAEQRLAVAERELARAQAELRHRDVVLAMHSTFSRCTSAPALFQAVGPDLVRWLQLSGCLIATRELANKQISFHFKHGLSAIPVPRLEAVTRALDSGTVVVPPPAGGLTSVVCPLRGATVEGFLYGERPAAKPLREDERQLLRAIAAEISGGCDHIALLRQVRQEERARQSLSRYLSDQVAQAVLDGRIDGRLGGERRVVTVLFVDVRRFTSLSERLPPERVLQVLNEHFAAAVPAIEQGMGAVDKFMGDALMAVFGAPNELVDHPLRAVRAAEQLRRCVAGLKQSWQSLPWAADVAGFDVGIGVNTGVVVAGNLGSEGRREYAVIGDAVNVASRLCGKAAPGQILIGADTAASVRGQVKLSAPTLLSVKGKEQPVEAFAVES